MDVYAVPEGTVVFPQEPLLRVDGPVVPCMLLETALLAVVNFQTLVATKAARVCLAAQGDPVLEFGLRRAQGIDGGLAASRAAYVGGCAATSNTLAGRLYGIPVKGTHAHSWVMLHDSEEEAFMEYARALPANCVFLVDTYGTLDGVRHAIQAGRWLRERGHEMVGIRLDSGDLAWLSIRARALLDEAGFPGAAILASNELDEIIIQSLKEQGARIAVWGVGTRLVTGQDDGALGGVYKLGAVRAGPDAPWERRVKVSEQASKTTIPGLLEVRRFETAEGFLADVIYDALLGLPEAPVMVDPLDLTRRRRDRGRDRGRGPARPGGPPRTPRVRPAAARGGARPDPGAARAAPRRREALREPAPVPGRPGAAALRRADPARAGGPRGGAVDGGPRHIPGGRGPSSGRLTGRPSVI